MKSKIKKALEDELEECLLDYSHVFIPTWSPHTDRGPAWLKDREDVMNRLAKAVMDELKDDEIVARALKESGVMRAAVTDLGG